jgi:FtsP/CotA-like multicopper oxidase with cupredoxin domain
MIPPFGIVTIWQRFDKAMGDEQLFGKSVFHCHFLDHEDQGMMAAVQILPENK